MARLQLGLNLTLLLVELFYCDVAVGAAGAAESGDAWKFDGWYPNHYLARQLGPAEKITVDGKLVGYSSHPVVPIPCHSSVGDDLLCCCCLRVPV